MTAPITEIPPASSRAKFRDGFGQRFLVTVDTEEEFDWEKPIAREGFSLHHVPRLKTFQQFCESEGVSPLYLVDWPIATSSLAADILRDPVREGKAEIGVQLHPWVNRPFEEEVSERNSYAGNLPRELEHAKFRCLRKTIEERFETLPRAYRAGRYGVGAHTVDVLRECGIAIDTSVRAKFDYSAAGGANFRGHPLYPYWLDDAHSVLELPLTTVFWGILRKHGDMLHPAMWRFPRLRGALTRMGLLERIPLTPEGVSVEEVIRGIDIAIDDGLPLLVLSFHSPSLEPGHTPYVREERDLEALYDWWRRVFAYLDQRGIAPTTAKEIVEAVEV
jgi:hypothetical protein